MSDLNLSGDRRTLALLSGLNSLLEAYERDLKDEKSLAKIIGTIRWFNQHFNRDELTKFVEKTGLSYRDTIKALLSEPIFYTH